MAESEKEENSRFMEQRSRRYDNILFSFEENDKQHSFPECRCDYFVSSPKHAFKEGVKAGREGLWPRVKRKRIPDLWSREVGGTTTFYFPSKKMISSIHSLNVGAITLFRLPNTLSKNSILYLRTKQNRVSSPKGVSKDLTILSLLLNTDA